MSDTAPPAPDGAPVTSGDLDQQALKSRIGITLIGGLVAIAEEVGEEVVENLDAASEYAADRAEHLSYIVGEPGWDEAVKAEADNVVIEVALRTVASADEFDDKLLQSARFSLALVSQAIRLILPTPPAATQP